MSRMTWFAVGTSAVLFACGGHAIDFSAPTDAGPLDGAGARGGSFSTGGASGTGGSWPDAAGTGGTTGGTGGTTGGSGGSTGGTGGFAGTAGAAGSAGSAGVGGTGGIGGSGGAAGTGGSFMGYVEAHHQAPKMDLLFAIDNSRSMADKQLLLNAALPDLITFLVIPWCIDPATRQAIGVSSNGACALGVLAHPPVTDLHVGIIDSSLGAYGADACDDTADAANGVSNPHNNDRGHLLSRDTSGAQVPTSEGRGFLVYNPAALAAAANETELNKPFVSMVNGVGTRGCGYEAPLESVYRFLVDPDPYSTLLVDTSIGGYGQSKISGTDDALLLQRSSFLRQDSLVSVMIFTDEDDCSIQATGQGFYPLLGFTQGHSVLQGGTSACQTNPNDVCCFNCGVASSPAGCPPPSADPACQKGELSMAADRRNLRCFDQKRKYGVDFRYPVARYAGGFSGAMVPDRQGNLVSNPLYGPYQCSSGNVCTPTRTRDRVMITGVVGVPWQDIAVNSNDLSAGFKTARQIADQGIWNVILGSPDNASGPIAPTDPHMLGSIDPRPGLPGPDSASTADPIGGHERSIGTDYLGAESPDLQYACIFPLATSRTCDSGSVDCDCTDSPAERRNPLCQNLGTGAYSNVQTRAKAYPAPRILQVLREIGDQAIVGSLCAANTIDRTRSDFGFNPTTRPIEDKISQLAQSQCLASAFTTDSIGQIPCSVIDVYEPAAGTTCACQDPNGITRKPAPEEMLTAEMKGKGSCRCLLPPVDASSLQRCRAGQVPTSEEPPINGWCYVDPGQTQGAGCNIVSQCPSGEKRAISFMSYASSPRGAMFLACTTDPRTTAIASACP